MRRHATSVAAATLLLLSARAAGWVVGAPHASFRPPLLRPALLRACAAPPSKPGDGAAGPRPVRTVRLVSPHADLMAAGATAKVAKKKKGIRTIQIGDKRIDFAHDMTQAFLWTGVMLALVVKKVVEKGTAAWRDELCRLLDQIDDHAIVLVDMSVPGLPLSHVNAAFAALTGYEHSESVDEGRR